MHYEKQPARALLTTAAVCAAVALLAGVLAVVAQLPGFWFLAFIAVVIAVPCVLFEVLTPRSVMGDEGGVEVRSRWRSRKVAWEHLRRVRRARFGSYPRHGDLLIERADGTLLTLPPAVASGTIEGWREQAGGARPADELPQTWRRSDPHAALWPVYASPLVGQLAVQSFRSDRDWVWIGVLAVLVGVAVGLGVTVRRRPPAVIADRSGLVIQGLRRRHVPWSQVREVCPVDRFDTTATVVLADGTTRKLPDVTVDVVEHWRTLAGDIPSPQSEQ